MRFEVIHRNMSIRVDDVGNKNEENRLFFQHLFSMIKFSYEIQINISSPRSLRFRNRLAEKKKEEINCLS